MFLLICILVMWMMIFGVACFYFGSLDKQLTPQVIYRFTLATLMATLIWVLGAYFLAFEGKTQTVLTLNSLSLGRALDLLFQLCFCLYAVVMLIGAIIDRGKTSHLLLLVVVWISLVYTLLAIVCGGFSWSLVTFLRHKEESTVALLNGMIVGLVTSTAGVGYLNTGEISLLTDYLSNQFPIDDVVDSFAMNGIGGFLGSLGLALLRSQWFLPQLFAIFITISLSAFVSVILGKHLLRNKTTCP